jgi:membrane-bound ClpP family serine protease
MLLLAIVLVVVVVVGVAVGMHAGPHGLLAGAGLAAIGALVLGVTLAFGGSSVSGVLGWGAVGLMGAVGVGATGLSVASLRKAAAVPSVEASTTASLLGAEGVALTDLAPTGTVRVQGETWTAQAIEGTIRKGARVFVADRQGLRLQVWTDEPDLQDHRQEA